MARNRRLPAALIALPVATFAAPAHAQLSPPVSAMTAPVTTAPAMSAPVTSASAITAPADPALATLLRQAGFWLQQNQPAKALGAVERVLATDPANPDALSAAARAEAMLDHREAAAGYLAKLRNTTAPRALKAEVAATLRSATIDPNALEEARALARDGNAGAAIARYRSLFGDAPPPAYALEYYQTLAGTTGGFDAGRSGLAQLTTQVPDDRRRQLAYAQTLTYRAQTRAEGIARLRVLAAEPNSGDAAARAWRQALFWQGAGSQAAADMAEYVQRFPQDDAAARKLAELRTAPPAAPPDAVSAARIGAYGKLDAGRLNEAAAGFRAALAASPDDPESVGGLGLVLLRQGRLPEARQMLERAIALAPQRRAQWQQAIDGTIPPAIPAGAPRRNPEDDAAGRAAALRRDAAAAPAQALPLLQRAVALAPDDPWARLDLARAMARQGDSAGARAVMEDRLATRPTPEALYAAALFAQSQNRAAESRALLERIPANRRNAAMSALMAGTQTESEIETARELARTGQAGEARRRLLALAARPDPDGRTIAAVIAAFGTLHDPAGAAEAAALAQRAGTPSTPDTRIALAGALLAAGQDAQAAAMVAGINAGVLSEAQMQGVQALKTGLAVRASDRLNASGERAAAYAELQPVLARDSGDPAASLALARLYLGAGQAGQAQRIAEATLVRDPRSLDARAAALDAAIALHDRARTEALITEGYAQNPQAARMVLMEAHAARSFGDDSRARRLLAQAAEQRRRELMLAGSDTGADSPPAFASPVQYAANPFQSPQPTTKYPGPAAAQDDVSAAISNEMAQLNTDSAPQFVGSVAARSRSGTSGLDRLSDVSAPISASFSPGAIPGKMTVGVTPVYADAGSVPGDTATQRRFGSTVLGGQGGSGSATARGVSVGAGYALRDFTADVASTPLGFRTTNVGGGVTFAPAITDNLRLRLTGERRAVTDSILSWGGERDPRTGRVWGGVMRTGGHAQLEYTTGPMTIYAGGGFAMLTGQNVASNTRAEGNAGLSYTIFKTGDSSLTTGADATYLAYQKNLSNFTFGQGGYFSPQSYAALSIPIDYRGKSGDLSYHIGASLGYAAFNEHSSPVFPNDPAYQASLAAAASGDPSVATSYRGQSHSGLTGGLRGDVDYLIAPTLHIGASASYEKTADWNEARGMIYLKKIFEPNP